VWRQEVSDQVDVVPQVYVLRQEVVEMTVDDRGIVDTGSDHNVVCIEIGRPGGGKERRKLQLEG